MSSFIENAARGIGNVLTGGGAAAPAEAAQKQRAKDLISNFVTGGAALGAGVSGGAALLSYLKSLSDEAAAEDEERLDDDTLYIRNPHAVKKAGLMDNKWLAPGLAVTGGVLSLGASYAAVQSIFNKIQAARRQKMLDEAQQGALSAADLELSGKSANDATMNLSDLITAGPVAMPLLVALATGGITATALNKAFPVIQSPKSKHPKRIRIMNDDGTMATPAQEGVPRDDLAKIAAAREAEAAAGEFLILLTDEIAMQKYATCITSDILNRVAKDGAREVTRVYMDQGLAGLTEVVKGASFHPAPAGDKLAAAALICKSAMLAPALTALAGAEYRDMLPGITAMVDTIPEDRLQKAAGLIPHIQASIVRVPLLGMLEKSASPVLRELVKALQGSAIAPAAPGEVEERDAALTSDISGSMAEDNEGQDPERDHDKDDESQGEDDVIDSFLVDPKSVGQALPQR